MNSSLIRIDGTVSTRTILTTIIVARIISSPNTYRNLTARKVNHEEGLYSGKNPEGDATRTFEIQV